MASEPTRDPKLVSAIARLRELVAGPKGGRADYGGVVTGAEAAIILAALAAPPASPVPSEEASAMLRTLASAFRKVLSPAEVDTLARWLRPERALEEFVEFLRTKSNPGVPIRSVDAGTLWSLARKCVEAGYDRCDVHRTYVRPLPSYEQLSAELDALASKLVDALPALPSAPELIGPDEEYSRGFQFPGPTGGIHSNVGTPQPGPNWSTKTR